jgi:hypothetical protein
MSGGGNAVGNNWSIRGQLFTTGWGSLAQITAMTWIGDRFVAGGNTGQIATSTDGLTWTYYATLKATTYASNPVYGLAYNGTVLVAIGGAGRVATSSDKGATWTYQGNLRTTAWGTVRQTLAINYFGGLFVVTGTNGVFATSPDGVTWTYRGAGAGWNSSWAMFGLSSSAGRLVGVGALGNVAYSTDAINYTTTNRLGSATDGSNANSVVGGQGSLAGLLFAVTSGGYMAVSADGSFWNPVSSFHTAWGTETINFIFNAIEMLVVIGNNGRVAVSKDGGTTWSVQSVKAGVTLWAGAGDTSKLIIGGELLATSP